MKRSVRYPFTLSEIRELKAGDEIRVSGLIHTGRDQLHRYLVEGNETPVDLKDGAIYHCGPVVIRKDDKWVVRSAGPTTSSRLDSFIPEIIRKFRVRVLLGKGGLGEQTRLACRKYGCVYIQVAGGAAALLADKVESVEGVHMMNEFGPAEAVWDLVVRDLPGIVTMDSRGVSLHKRIRRSSRMSLKSLLSEDVGIR